MGQPTGPVTDRVPPVKTDTLEAVQAAAESEILAPHRKPDGGTQLQQEKQEPGMETKTGRFPRG